MQMFYHRGLVKKKPINHNLRWGLSQVSGHWSLRLKRKFGFIKRVDKDQITAAKDLESWRFECQPFVRRNRGIVGCGWLLRGWGGALPLVQIWSHEFVKKLMTWEAFIDSVWRERLQWYEIKKSLLVWRDHVLYLPARSTKLTIAVLVIICPASFFPFWMKVMATIVWARLKIWWITRQFSFSLWQRIYIILQVKKSSLFHGPNLKKKYSLSLWKANLRSQPHCPY